MGGESRGNVGSVEGEPVIFNVKSIDKPKWMNDDRRYYTYRWHLKEFFGREIWSASIDAGMTCPNIDGTVARGGCTFCRTSAYTPINRQQVKSVADQVDRQITRLKKRRKDFGVLAYFQAGTNTYAPTEKLRELFLAATANPEVVGLVVGTRPDSISESTLDLLSEFAERMYVSVEYGLQTIHEPSLRKVNRGHGSDIFFTAVEQSLNRGLKIGAHVILGLPGETQEQMLMTARALARCPIDLLKIHSLHVTKKTVIEREYEKGQIPLLSMEEYSHLLMSFLEELSPHIVIQRAMGDCPADDLVAPRWVLDKQKFLRYLHQLLREKDSWQGKRFMEKSPSDNRLKGNRDAHDDCLSSAVF